VCARARRAANMVVCVCGLQMELWLEKGLQSLSVVCHVCRSSRTADFPELLVRCSYCYKVRAIAVFVELLVVSCVLLEQAVVSKRTPPLCSRCSAGAASHGGTTWTLIKWRKTSAAGRSGCATRATAPASAPSALPAAGPHHHVPLPSLRLRVCRVCRAVCARARVR
jgi:hypothetical protein